MLRWSLSAFLIISAVIFASLLLANLASMIQVSESEKSFPLIKQEHMNEIPVISDSPDSLIWFLQISDIHISKFRDPNRVKHLSEFCSQTIEVIKPSLVLASGDLTDAKSRLVLSSKQYREEWRAYKKTLDDCKVLNKVKAWLDIRGNHDLFNEVGRLTGQDFFSNYSITKSARSYRFTISDAAGTKYSFIAVDACLDVGLKRPFNFVGVLTSEDLLELNDLLAESQREGSNYTIWFGHYPTSCVMAQDSGPRGFRKLIGKHKESVAYLSGHLHTLGDTVPRMYTLQHEGFLELELGDWMNHRLFRLAVFDHGLFSFIDLKHGEWPVVLFTNPKSALFNNPTKEDLRLQLISSHIRLLAFSPAKIKECRIKLDQDIWSNCQQVNDNLFVHKWDPSRYNMGIHKVFAYIRDADGRSKLIEQEFALDGSRPQGFDILARLVLMGDLHEFLKALFTFAVCICTIPLLFFRFWHILVKYNALQRPRIRMLKTYSRKMWILATVNRLFYPLVGYCLYLTFGPWSFGELVDGHFGIVFVWGIIVNGALLPSTLTFMYGFFQLMFCQLPLIIVYATIVDKRFQSRKLSGVTKEYSFWIAIIRSTTFSGIMAVELILSLIFWYEYGTLAFILTPVRAWSIVLNMVLFYQANNLPPKCLHSAAIVWGADVKSSLSQE